MPECNDFLAFNWLDQCQTATSPTSPPHNTPHLPTCSQAFFLLAAWFGFIQIKTFQLPIFHQSQGNPTRHSLIGCLVKKLENFNVVFVRILYSSYLRANWKLADELVDTFLGLSAGLLPARQTQAGV
jgi:hypothetical protein